jgi:hypothetical protein
MRGEYAWLRCQSGSDPPFGGITRIRFKGFVYDVSAKAAPPLYALYI